MIRLPIAALAVAAAISLTSPSPGQEEITPDEFELVLAELEEASLTAEEIGGLDNVEFVTVVQLNDVVGPDQYDRLAEFLDLSRTNVEELRQAVAANDPIASALSSANAPVESVIAVTGQEGGTIAVYVGDVTDGSIPNDFVTAMIDLRERSLNSEDIRTLDAYETISFVQLDEVVEDREREAIQEVLADTEAGFAGVQVAIRANELLEAAVDEEEVDIRNIIAMTGEEGGDLIVYLGEPTVQQ